MNEIIFLSNVNSFYVKYMLCEIEIWLSMNFNSWDIVYLNFPLNEFWEQSEEDYMCLWAIGQWDRSYPIVMDYEIEYWINRNALSLRGDFGIMQYLS
jgi:hypothetical protein